VTLPQAKPLSKSEILGCTAPKLVDIDAIIYVGDGRFHLESIMIANERVTAYKYDPYSKIFSREYYEFEQMKSNRQKQIERSSIPANSKKPTVAYGLILSTLGRQGSPKILQNLINKLEEMHKSYHLLLMSEIFPDKLKQFGDQIDTWVQVACPRLSIDWGEYFDRPLLTPYEAMVSLKQVEWQKEYPMDYYANESLGNWTVNDPSNRASMPKSKIRIEYDTNNASK